MNPPQTFDQNNILQGTFLGSKYFNPFYLFDQGYLFFQNLYYIITSNQVRNLYYFIIFLLATFFLTLIIYCIIRLFEIRKKEQAHLEHEIAEYAHHKAEREKKMQAGEGGVSDNPRWMETLNYLFSNNPSDWKLAIMEADSMLDSLLDQLGFRGENLGEKLKSATQDKFRNLSAAWEVHTIRNRIAHEGLSYEISQHEAKRVIALYERIFRDYGFI
ncbi:MAG: hypothetical protein KGL67_01030 [Patescibacteria group bacterium]|nr:hypothetical protein [Patescibacteria group bacterium]